MSGQQDTQWLEIDGKKILVDKTHRFGTDALLLFRFVKVRPQERVCDLCSGSGILSAALCAAGHRGPVFAVELQKEAVALFEKTIAENGFDNVTPICCDLRDKQTLDYRIGNNSLDLIVCNPPYYQEGSGAKSPEQARGLCRSDASADIEQVASAARRLLRHGGRLCLCFKPQRLCDCFEALRKNGLEPKRLQTVHKTEKDAPWLVLLEAKKGAAPFLQVLPPKLLYAQKETQER